MIMEYINYKLTGFNLVVDFLQLFVKIFICVLTNLKCCGIIYML